MTWPLALLAATALHLGFQLTVTLVTYPTLALVGPERWQSVHPAHSRGIVPVVALAYGATLVTCVGALLSAPAAPGAWLAAAGTGLAMLVTATVAAPTHGRLAAGPEPGLLHRLLVADRVRCAGAVLGLVGGLLHALR